MDTTITDVVYMDVGLCFEGVRQDRTLGDQALCTSTQPLGRIVMGETALPQPCCCHAFAPRVGHLERGASQQGHLRAALPRPWPEQVLRTPMQTHKLMLPGVEGQ